LTEALVAVVPRATPERLLAIYMLDRNGFKPVNDQYGHDVGDELLVAVGARLTSAVRAQDIVARVGGDEFVVVATDVTSEAKAVELGDKLLAVFRAPFACGEQECRVGVTIGYVLAPLDGVHIAELIKAADAAMYAGKQRGKGMVVRALA
jgi:diguanylate cyclase (GGDEF)-like protein